jgi:hypothetical protein
MFKTTITEGIGPETSKLVLSPETQVEDVLKCIADLIKTTFERTETFGSDPELSATLLYIIGELAGVFCRVSLEEGDGSLRWLQDNFAPEHEIWNHIETHEQY